MVDSRQKGARAEAALVKLLKEDTGLNWKRTPGSGALHPDHLMKGDAYVPGEHNLYCVEVKHYKECQLTSKVLTDKAPMLLQWWSQAVRQGEQVSKKPLLFFKHDRSKWFVMFSNINITLDNLRGLYLYPEQVGVLEYSTFIKHAEIQWIK